MIYTTTVIQEKNELNGIEQITQIDVDFSDEGINLQGSVKVVGEWQQYLKTFEQDMRNNHKSLFPLPEPKPEDEEMI